MLDDDALLTAGWWCALEWPEQRDRVLNLLQVAANAQHSLHSILVVHLKIFRKQVKSMRNEFDWGILA